MKIKNLISFSFLAFCFCYWMSSCKHDPIQMDDDMMMIDTMPVDTMPSDTTPVDTTGNDVPCDPNIIYFETDILPLLHSNCAFSGCHDAASAEDGVILENYETVIATADVEPFNLDDSEIYEVLVDSDMDERMPPAPTAPLDQSQIQLIATWILQGAENLFCDPDLEPCAAESVSFAETVAPVLDLYCVGCHSGNPPSGGIDLSTYTGVKSIVDAGRFVGAIKWESGFSPMPKNAPQLPDCELEQLTAWVADGALDN